ncbi:MAG: protein kinase [Chloroflexi bacterium]|nr:protein kinase [Chloroflexota bacterium]
MQKFGRYEIRGELGRGGMATVYRAYDPLFEREVAIKVLPASFTDDPQFRKRFEREARIVARLEHPAVVPVYDVGEEDGQPFFVMRYMSGGSLADRLKKGPLSLQETLRLLEHLGPALDEAHRKGIVHRDLKPANILFDASGLPYLSDFGIAKIVSGSQQTTLTGDLIVGTPAYISPEQAKGEAVDGRSDIYSLGAILYHMLSGQPPYQADTPMSLALKHITEPPPDILQVNPSLPPAVAALIRKAMAKDPNERFSTAGELVAALRQVVEGKTPAFLMETAPTLNMPATVAAQRPSATAPKAFPFWTLLLAGALLLIVGIGVWLGTGMLRRASPRGAATPSSPAPAATLPSAPAPQATTPAPNLPPEAPSPTVAPTPAFTETVSPSPTATPYQPPIIGGADAVALVASNEIWLASLDGEKVEQLTNDGAQKRNLSWLPDHKHLLYVTGRCINLLDVESRENRTITCIEGAGLLEAVRPSPDGRWLALSVDRELYIVPFDLQALERIRQRQGLRALIDTRGCLFYNQIAVKDMHWPRQGWKLALQVLGVSGSRRVDAIVLYDFRDCKAGMPFKLDEFPAERFAISGYGEHPLIPSFDWDGETLFVLNGFRRNDGFGDLYEYNAELRKGRQINPLGVCCYRDARWSPDGRYLIFAFQDIRQGPEGRIEVYYVQYGTIGSGMQYTPLALPPFFSRPDEKPQFALRPVAQP